MTYAILPPAGWHNMRIPAWYSSVYAPPQVPLLARLNNTYQMLRRLQLIEPMQPARFDRSQLLGLHHSDYTQAFLVGHNPLASKQGIAWSPAMRDATLSMLSGQLEGARFLLQHGGVAMNIARGFHHAHPAAGSAFCPINGLALLAHVFADKRILVIDCDEHGGNGTEEFTRQLPNLFNISLFGTRFGCRGSKRSWAFHITHEQGFNGYTRALLETAAITEEITPDLIVYQAGADCHRQDPKSLLRLTTKELFRRDLFVFQLAKRLQLPLLFVVAGGYQHPDRVARLNANTVRAARISAS